MSETVEVDESNSQGQVNVPITHKHTYAFINKSTIDPPENYD